MVRWLLYLILTVSSIAYDGHLAEAQSGNFCPINMIQLYNGITCQTDQACQRLSSGFFCYRGHCCANSVSLPGGYGSACSSNNQCSFGQAECLGGICYCRLGFSFDGQYCQPSQFSSNPFITSNRLITQRNCAPNEVSVGGNCYRLRSYFDECDFTQQCDYVGAICSNRKCLCAYNDIFNGFQCVRDSMLNAPVSCQSNQISINNQCYPAVDIGKTCTYDQQCQPRFSDGNMACINGICQPTGPRDQSVACRNPAASVEMVGLVPKNCVTSLCGAGFYCEYNSAILQYICCGGDSNGPFGNIKMYPGHTNLPLQCNGINSCTFVDYPNCIYSPSYKHNVCCSTYQCF